MEISLSVWSRKMKDPPGKNTGVGCHFLLQCMKVKSESEVALSCLTLSDPMEYLYGSIQQDQTAERTNLPSV